MGSFLLKDDNFKDDEEEIYKEIDKDDINYNVNGIYQNKSNTKLIVVSVFFIILLNVFLFWFFYYDATDGIIEIPENKQYKQYVEEFDKKDSSVYELVSKKQHKQKSFNIIKHEDEVQIDDDKIYENISLTDEEVDNELKNLTKSVITKKSSSNFIESKNIKEVDIENNPDDISEDKKIQNNIDVNSVFSMVKEDSSLDKGVFSDKEKTFKVNIGVFLSYDLAKEAYTNFASKNNSISHLPYYIVPQNIDGKVVYKILIGEFIKYEDVSKLSSDLDAIGISNTIEEF